MMNVPLVLKTHHKAECISFSMVEWLVPLFSTWTTPPEMAIGWMNEWVPPLLALSQSPNWQKDCHFAFHKRNHPSQSYNSAGKEHDTSGVHEFEHRCSGKRKKKKPSIDDISQKSCPSKKIPGPRTFNSFLVPFFGEAQ